MRRSALLASLAGAALTACDRARAPVVTSHGPHGRAVRILALGDSLALGQGASAPRNGFIFRAYLTVREQRPGSRIDSYAIAGSTAADVLRLQVPRVRGARADAVIVCVGGNDVLRRVSASAFAARYTAIVRGIRAALPHAAVVCCGVPDVGRSPLFTGLEKGAVALLARENDDSVRAAAAREHATFVDLFAATSGAGGDVDRLLSEDRFHPSDAGYRRLAAVLTPALLRALPR